MMASDVVDWQNEVLFCHALQMEKKLLGFFLFFTFLGNYLGWTV
jgi:hypothetical protein